GSGGEEHGPAEARHRLRGVETAEVTRPGEADDELRRGTQGRRGDERRRPAHRGADDPHATRAEPPELAGGGDHVSVETRRRRGAGLRRAGTAEAEREDAVALAAELSPVRDPLAEVAAELMGENDADASGAERDAEQACAVRGGETDELRGERLVGGAELDRSRARGRRRGQNQRRRGGDHDEPSPHLSA